MSLFHLELTQYIIPLVELKYSTYTASGADDDLKAARGHRAFGGFSMGAATTWYTFIQCLDYFSYFIPLSGDCWALGQKAGKDKPVETAEYLASVVRSSQYSPRDYYLLCATGDGDIAYPNLAPQIEAMKKLEDCFVYSPDLSKGNFYFIVCKGGIHTWEWQNQYLYDILPDLFTHSLKPTNS